MDDNVTLENPFTHTQGNMRSLDHHNLFICLKLNAGYVHYTSLTQHLILSLQIELLDTIALNLHRIDKDVQRCDRNYYYFTTANLDRLRNIMCRYINIHHEQGRQV